MLVINNLETLKEAMESSSKFENMKDNRKAAYVVISLDQARYIKSIMKTSEAGCYRISHFSKYDTLENIATLIELMQPGKCETLQEAEEKHEKWLKMFKTDFYKKSPNYCHFLAVIYDLLHKGENN